MRVAFAGTPPFAARALEALAAAGYTLPLVLTQPDRPAGRGMRLASSAVAEAATRLGLPLAKPETLRDSGSMQALRDAAPDVMVVAAYGLILPRAVLDVPPLGCINIHGSLLPRWRGAAPIQRALLAGDAVTGITIMRMDVGLDMGPMLATHEIPIGARDTTGSLTEALADLGARAIVDALAHIDSLAARPQDNALATYAAKITKADARIDWGRPAAELDRQIRALNPAPGAESRLGGEPLKIWEATAIDASGNPGEVLAADDGDLVVAAERGALRLHTVQRPGARRMSVADFLRGSAIRRGLTFDAAVTG